MKKIQSLIPKIILLLIIISAFLLMLGPAKQDSAIMDELAHIPAGYSYIKFFDYRLNPEHPPLVKVLSALPLLFQKLNFPSDKDAWQNRVNGEWAAGTQFLYESGNDADKIIFNSRLLPMLLTLILIAFVYFWSNELLGKWWALLPATLIAFSPNFLAHGHYVATDIGASLGFLIAIYFFLKSIYKPSKKNIIMAGFAFGFAELLKFSTMFLAPFFILIAIIVFWEKAIKEIKSPVAENLPPRQFYWYGGKFKKIFKYFIRNFGQIILIFAIGGLLIYAVYFFFTLNYPIEKQYSDTGAILQSFGNRYLADPIITMSQNKFFRPLGEYFLGGLMAMQRSASGSANYFLGRISGGNWNYFPVIFLMKETLPALIIIFFAIIFNFCAIFKTIAKGGGVVKSRFLEYLAIDFSEFSMLLFVAGYWAYSMTSSLNIGFRHIMPTLPFIYILAAQTLKKWFHVSPKAISDGLAEEFLNAVNRILNLFVKTSILSALVIWLSINAAFSHPFHLSRFNEFFGGTYDGYKYAADSNFDWGQDLKRLKKWVDNPPVGPAGQAEKVDKIAIDYFGGGNVKYYFGEKAEIWNSAAGNPIENGIKWLAISANTLQNAISKTAPGFYKEPQDEYLWLKNPLSPDYKAGTSIFIYKLSE